MKWPIKLEHANIEPQQQIPKIQISMITKDIKKTSINQTVTNKHRSFSQNGRGNVQLTLVYHRTLTTEASDCYVSSSPQSFTKTNLSIVYIYCISKSYIFWPHKRGDPTNTFFRWDFLSSLGFGAFGPGLCGLSFTWNLFLHYCWRKRIFLKYVVVGNFWAWPTNMEPTQGPHAFNRFQGHCMLHTQKFHTKRQRKRKQVLNKILFKTMSKSCFFWPHKGGTPQKHLSGEISSLL